LTKAGSNRNLPFAGIGSAAALPPQRLFAFLENTRHRPVPAKQKNKKMAT
jgi:hypothetical protein